MLARITRRIIMQKARPHPPCGRLGLLCRLTVSGSISLGFRRSFHLSLTVLVHYRASTCIVALEDGPPSFPPGSTCPMVLGYPLHSPTGRFRLPDCHRLWWAVPDPSTIASGKTGALRRTPRRTRNPLTATHEGLTPSRFGLLPVRSPLLRQSRLISFPADTEMFHFPACRSTPPMHSAVGLP